MAVVNTVNAPVTLEWITAESASPALAIVQPDGTTLTPAITPTYGASKYTATFTPTLPGRHTLLWSTTAAAYADVVDVWSTDPHYLVSRSDAIERLRKSYTAVDATFDALGLYIAAATAVVEDVTGPIIAAATTWTEVPTRYEPSILLPHPGVTVTEITIDGEALATDAYVVDARAGVVHARGTSFSPYSQVVVAYTVGGAQVPAQARLACLEIIAHMWQSTRQGARPVQAGEDLAVTPMGFAIPRRALELLQSMPRTAGMA